MKATVCAVLLLIAMVGTSSGIGCGSQVRFPIVDSGIEEYPSKTSVFGIPILAGLKWSEVKINHLASVLAKLIDQDEDGCADDPLVLEGLRLIEYGYQVAEVLLDEEDDSNTAYGVISKFQHSMGTTVVENQSKPECSGLNFTPTSPNDPNHCQDATVEEIFHFITSYGYSYAYPTLFGLYWESKSQLTDAMDVARGRRYKDVPQKYRKRAWYTYGEEGCTYNCQTNEYIWWGYCVYSGICAPRAGVPAYEDEFKYQTKPELLVKDVKLIKLFQETANFPTKPVDGTYYGCLTCPSGGPGVMDEVESKYYIIEIVFEIFIFLNIFTKFLCMF